MIYEREGLLLPERNTPQIDHELHISLSDVIGDVNETYIDLKVGPLKQEKILELWHNGQDADLSAELLDLSELEFRKNSLMDWKSDLINNRDVDPLVKQLYRWSVNEHIANVEILIGSAKHNPDHFRRYNEFIYGKPDEDVYRGALDWVAHDADVLLQKPNQYPSVIAVAQQVKSLLDGKRGYRELLIPDDKTFEAVRSDHMRRTGYYGLLLAGIDIPSGKITTEIGDPILEKVLQNIASTKSIVDADGASWAISSRGVERPAVLNMPVERFIGLGLGHEIGSHELERTNGGRGPLALAIDGLDRTENGNEGRAVIREQVLYQTFDEFGKLIRWRDILRRHIAISFASGVGEERPATSSQTYAFINAIDHMYQVKLIPDSPEAAFSAARKKTDELLLRVLKGTDGKGGAYFKYKSYLEGVVACWQTAALRGASAISQGDIGKHDINNSRHIEAFRKVGLLPVGE